MSMENIRQMAVRKRLEKVRVGGNGRAALVTWDSIPTRYKEVIKEKYGNPVEMLRVNRLKNLIEPDSRAQRFYYEYTYGTGVHLTPEKQLEYTTNAQVLNAAIQLKGLIKNGKSKEEASRVWEVISDGINRLDKEDYPHSLPTSPEVIERKVRQYRQEGYAALIHKNFGNQAAIKVSDEAQQAVLLRLATHKNNFGDAEIARLYNDIASKVEGWKPITARTCGVWREKNALLTRSFRGGIQHFNNAIAMQNRRQKPSHPLYYWTMDGWDVELLYQRTQENKNGHRVTTYHNRVVMVLVLDPSVMYPIGYAIGTEESPTLIREALREAILHTKELFGNRMMPHQLQSDNYAKKTLRPLYEEICRMYTPARVKNAKSKIVEPYFNYLNRNYCKYANNWSGYGITSRKENQPNDDMINSAKKLFPDFEGVCKQINAMIAIERGNKYDQLMELWAETPAENKLEMSIDRYLWSFGESTEPNRISSGALSSRALGEAQYNSFDPNFRMSLAEQWVMKYDPRDTSQVLAVSTDGKKRYVLERSDLQPMALMDQQEGDAARRAMVEAHNKGILGMLNATNNKQIETVDEFLSLNSHLEATTLAAHLITDSRGQHKKQLREAKNTIEGPRKQPVAVEKYEMAEMYEERIRKMDLSEYVEE